VKLGSENSKKTMVAIGLAVVALFMVIRMFDFGSSNPSAAPNTASATPAAPVPRAAAARRGRPGSKPNAAGPVTTSLDPRLHLHDLNVTENTEYTGKGRNIFLAQAEDVIPTPQGSAFKKTEAKITPPPPPVYTPPPPPPMDIKFFGFASDQGVKRVFLSNGSNDVFVASEGEIVNRRYKIVKINANNIEVLDVLNNNQQTIPLTTS
jgi:hypothetical protein